MCTISFSPLRQGVLLAMNRDESIAREVPKPPQIFSFADVRAVYPTEANGGTWIAANDQGLLFGLLNKNGDGRMKRISRGLVIPNLVMARSLPEVEVRLREGKICGMLPFTLVTFDTVTRAIAEIVWDGVQISVAQVPWVTRHWFSSGLSDRDAAAIRGRVCDVFHEQFISSPENIRELHRSHSPDHGAYSICVHRQDVRSVSYSEIVVEGEMADFIYAAGSPCERAELEHTKFNLTRDASREEHSGRQPIST